MPSFDDLVFLLAGIHVTDRKRDRAVAVAGHLVASTLEEHWHKLPKRQRDILIRASANRLWDDYMAKRKLEELKPEEAAQDAILDEQTILQQLLNPDKTNGGPLGQLPGF